MRHLHQLLHRRHESAQTEGLVLSRARLYDLGTWLMSFGREGRLRRATVDLAPARSGEQVLEIGCGTGSLALAAAEVVGAAGRVCGIDPSATMIARAGAKAARRGLRLELQVGVAEALPYADASFDVVLASLMLHHLPEETMRAALAEVRRVLRPGGRFLAVDFGAEHLGWMRKVARHVHHHELSFDPLAAAATRLRELGLTVETGPAGFRRLVYLRATS